MSTQASTAKSQDLRFEYTSSYNDVLQGLTIAEKTNKNKQWNLYVMMSLIIASVGIVSSFMGESSSKYAGVFIFCVGIYLFTRLVFTPAYTRKKVAKKIDSLGDKYIVTFDSIQMTIQIDEDIKTVVYRSVFVRNSPELLIIILSSGELIAIPQKVMGEKAPIVAFLLKNNIGDRYKQL